MFIFILHSVSNTYWNKKDMDQNNFIPILNSVKSKIENITNIAALQRCKKYYLQLYLINKEEIRDKSASSKAMKYFQIMQNTKVTPNETLAQIDMR